VERRAGCEIEAGTWLHLARREAVGSPLVDGRRRGGALRLVGSRRVGGGR
jgi:hypothetical protein